MLARLRPWLAPLLAVTANSPIAGGHDTGWASWRYVIQSRWPTAVPPAAWPDAAAYDTAVRRLIAQGAALDEPSIYFLARLSPRYPTVEVRVADVCLDAGTAVLLAGLTRALVATALAEARRGTPAAAAPARQVAAALAAAARQGLAGAGVNPVTGQAVDATALRSRLLDHVYPALSDHGDTETITRLLHRLDRGGPEPTASEPCSPAPHPRPCSSPHSPARRCPATSRAAAAGPMPGSRQRQARSSSVSAVAAICCHRQATRPYPAVVLHPGPNRRAAGATRSSTGPASATCSCTSTESHPSCARQPDDSQFSGLAVFAGGLEEANAIMDADPAVEAACSPTRSIRCAASRGHPAGLTTRPAQPRRGHLSNRTNLVGSRVGECGGTGASSMQSI